MADLDQVMDDTAAQINTWLAPYQPNIPFLFPNTAQTAGVIPATLIAAGYPIQQHVMKRLENKLTQVSVFDLKQGTVFPFINRGPEQITLGTGTPASGTEYVEIGREKKRIAVQVWAYSKDSRQSIAQLLRLNLGDNYRLRHADGTLTLFKYVKQESEDYEQSDSVYVRTFTFDADFTEVLGVPVTTVVETITNINPSGGVVKTTLVNQL
jgi:hypothetical protein